MRRVAAAAVLLMLFTQVLHAQEEAVEQLPGVGHIVFPSRPKVTINAGVYMYQLLADSVQFVAAVNDFSKTTDEQTLIDDVEQYYQDLIAGIRKERMGQLLSQRYFETSGFKGIELRIRTNHPTDGVLITVSRLVLVNNVLASVACNLKLDREAESARDVNRFLNSLSITEKK